MSIYERFYNNICNLIDKSNPITKNLFLYGENLGATSELLNCIVKHIEKDNDAAKIVQVNCGENALLDIDLKALYDEILYKLDSHDKMTSIKFTGEFFNKMNDIITLKRWSSVYIILKNFEKLKYFSSSNLNVLANMSHFLNNDKVNLITIFHSRIPPNKIFEEYHNSEIYSLFIPNLSEKEIVNSLIKEHDDNFIYNYYVEEMVKSLYNICSNVSELFYIIKSSWKHFQGMLDENYTYDKWDLAAKWKIPLKNIISLLYTRVPDDQIMMNKSQELNLRCLQLPYKCRFLLIAGFIASYNSKSNDKELFLSKELSSKLSKRQKKSIKKHEKANSSLSGPKSFSLDRLFAIYFCIMDEKIEDNYWFVIKLVNNLVDTRLFMSIRSKCDPLKSEKYICVTSYEFIIDVAKSVNFDIGKYLLDF